MAFWNKSGTTKTCTDCREEYEPTGSGQKRCKVCRLKERRRQSRKYQASLSKEFKRERDKRYYDSHREITVTRHNELQTFKRVTAPEKYILQRAKHSAKQRGIGFSLVKEDIKVPEQCPVFGVPFKYNTSYAMSVDRIDNSRGYEKGNIQIISRRANLMKNDATPKELLQFADWIYKNYGK